jgi:hypothetical protein
MLLFKKAIVNIISKKGYNIVEKTKRNYLPITDYSQAIYSRGDIFFEIDTDIACNFNQFFFGKNNWHYHTKMTENIMVNNNIEYKGSILEKFYSTYKPKTFYDLYFVVNKPKNLTEADYEVLNENLNVYKYDLWSDVRQRVHMDKVHEYGLLRSHGTQHYGPVSNEKGKLELNRLKDTYSSILKHGHNPEAFGFITGYFLKYMSNYRFIILDGNHRTGVLSAMKYDKIPVIFQEKFPRVIDYDDISNFPHVKNGLFSENLAQQIFKSYFEDNGVNKAKKLGLFDTVQDF